MPTFAVFHYMAAYTVLSFDQFEFDQYYEIDRIADVCSLGEHKRVALQFPDYLLSDAPKVCFEMNKRFELKFSGEDKSKKPFAFVLGDTLFGSCCIDLIAAQHYGADALVHYGNACFTPTNDVPIPVYFVLDKMAVTDDGLEAVNCQVNQTNNPLIIAYDPGYHHSVIKVVDSAHKFNPSRPIFVLEPQVAVMPCEDADAVEGHLKKEIISRRLIRKVDESTGELVFCSDGLPPSTPNFDCLVLSSSSKEEDKFLETLALKLFTKVSNWIVIDPCVGEKVPFNLFRVASKRNIGISALKSASSVGIVCCSPGLACAPLAQRLVSRLLRKNGVTTHSIVMSKLTGGKFENFIDVDMFIQIGCPEHHILPISETRRALALASDALYAFEVLEWDGSAVLDLPEFVEVTSKYLISELEKEKHETTTDQNSNKDSSSASTTLALLLSNEKSLVAGRTLDERLVDVKSRSYSGVEFGVPVDSPADFRIRKGKKGIANHYESDDRLKQGLAAEDINDQIFTR